MWVSHLCGSGRYVGFSLIQPGYLPHWPLHLARPPPSLTHISSAPWDQSKPTYSHTVEHNMLVNYPYYVNIKQCPDWRWMYSTVPCQSVYWRCAQVHISHDSTNTCNVRTDLTKTFSYRTEIVYSGPYRSRLACTRIFRIGPGSMSINSFLS